MLIAEVGEHQRIATFSPHDATNTGVTWESSDPNVAAAITTGLVKPLWMGTATITATTADGGHTAYCAVTVGPAPPVHVLVTGVTLSDNTLMQIVAVGEHQLITTFSQPDATNTGVTWESSDPNVAAAITTGLVKPLWVGTAPPSQPLQLTAVTLLAAL